MNPSELRSAISAEIDKIADIYYIRGLREGITATKRVAGWYQENPRLLHPYDTEVLRQWTDELISSLEDRCNRETI
jgi:hypothetical protein